MTALVILLLALALGAGFVVLVMGDPGYILITLQPWSIELSLALFLFLLLAVFVILYIAVRTLVRVWQSPRDLSKWNKQRQQQKARQLQTRGIMDIVEGDWQKAERRLIGHLDNTDTPALSFLGAAHAAHGRGDFAKRDHYLAQAIETDPDSSNAIRLTQAALQYRCGQYDHAWETLKRLSADTPKNPRLLSLSVKVLEQLQNWNALLEIIPMARKRNAVPEVELERLQQLASRHLLTHSVDQSSVEEVWRSLDRNQRNNPELIAAYAERLIAEDKGTQAADLLSKAINKRWDPELVRLFGRVKTADPAAQLKTAEKWTAEHEDSPELMLTLAQLCLRNELWGKARGYLEAGINNGGDVELYRELGHLLEQLNEGDKALEYYRKGIDQAAPRDLSASKSLRTTGAP